MEIKDKYIVLLLNTSPFICLFLKYGLNRCFTSISIKIMIVDVVS